MPQFYKYHKKHHEWTAPIGMVAVYCGPVEHFFGNILPVSAGPFIMKSHLLVAWLWWVLLLSIFLNWISVFFTVVYRLLII